VARRARSAHLGGDLARKIEHFPVEEEEAREADLSDERKLLAQAGVGPVAKKGRRLPVALLEGPPADLRKPRVGGLLPVGKVGIAVAELLRQVELEPLGELLGCPDGVRILGKAGGLLLGCDEDELLVAPPFRLTALERGLVLDGHERVLESRAAQVVGVDVAGCDRTDAELAGELSQGCVAPRVPAQIRALELDVEALAAESAGEPGGGVRMADGEAGARAAGKTHEPFVPLLECGGIESRLETLGGMSLRDEAAQVRVATRCLHEERDVRAVEERELGARQRAQPDCLGGMRELERAVQPVVVGERERGIAELGGLKRKLLGERCAVEEGVGAVAVELDVRRRAHVRPCSRTARHTFAFRRYARKREVGWAYPIPKPYAC
jgi:hypothetical protein